MTCMTGNVLINNILRLRHPVVDPSIYRILKYYFSPTAMQPIVKDFNVMFVWFDTSYIIRSNGSTKKSNNPVPHYGEVFAELVQEKLGKDDMAF